MLSSEHGKRITGDGQEAARVRIHDHSRGLSAARLPRVAGQNRRDAQLKTRIDRQVHVACPGEQCRGRGIVRVVAMPQQRHEVAIVSPDREHRPAGLIARLDCRRTIVEAAQPIFGVALDVGRIGGAEVQPRARIAQQVKGGAANRITALDRIGARRVERRAEFAVRLSRFAHYRRVSGCERETLAVVDGSPRDTAHDVEHALVVLITANAIA